MTSPIIQDMLLSGEPDNNNAAHAAVHQIDTYYWDRNLDSDPLRAFGFRRMMIMLFLMFLLSFIQ